MANDNYVGKTIAGKFRVEQLIGEGGMGRVFRATQTALDKPVCLKVLRKSLLSDERTVARFQREAKAASRLNHPNSISIIDFGACDDGALYIAMEYVAGEDLHQVLSKDGPLPEKRVIRIMSQVLAALTDAHAAGVIHRDLKPENIMVEQRRGDPDFVKVLDFGIAKIQELPGEEPSQALTRAGFVCGTPEYMSPEQARGAALDARSDLYAVGVMLYQCLTGVLPFEADSAVGFATMHLTTDPEPPRKKRADLAISESMNSLVLKAMSKDPNDRPQTAEVFRAELLAVGEGIRVTPLPMDLDGDATRPVSSSSRLRAFAPSELRITRPSSDRALRPDSRRRRKRSDAVSIAVSVILALAVGAAAGLWAFSRIAGKPTSQTTEPPATPSPVAETRMPRRTETTARPHDNPKPPTPPAPTDGHPDVDSARKLIAAADSLFRAGEVDQAIKLYMKAHSEAASPSVARKLAMCYLHQNNVDEARKWLVEYTAAHPDAPDAVIFRKHLSDPRP
jgi:eukaryotic-like serine/threonine-protein kinase